MSGSKYFVYGERWRELDASEGLVAGWTRRVQFLYVRRGRLRVAKRRRVLAALQAYAANRPSAITLGSRLSMYSGSKQKECLGYKKSSSVLPSSLQSAPHPAAYTPQRAAYAPCIHPAPCAHPAPCGHAALHQCCAHHTGCNNNSIQQARYDVTPQRTTTDVPTTIIPNNTIQVPADKPNIEKSDKIVNNKQNTSGSKFVSLLQEHTVIKKKPILERDTKGRFLSARKKRVNAVKVSNNIKDKDKKEKENNKKNDYSDDDDEDDDESEDLCKELTIPDSDVRALRSYVARTRRDALMRFDADNEYKLALFYAINPLVYVERCAKTERAIRDRHPMALAPFAARLGLTPSPHPGTESTQPSRKLRAQVRQQKLHNASSTSNKQYTRKVEYDSESEDEDFQKSSRNKRSSLRNLTPQFKDIVNKDEGVNRENKKQHSTVYGVKNNNKKSTNDKTTNMQKKSNNQDSDIDYKSKVNKNKSISRSDDAKIIKRHNNKRDRESTDSESTESDNTNSSESDSDSENENTRDSYRKRVMQNKQKKQDSSSDETSETDDNSNKNKSLNKNRETRKNNAQDTDSDSDSATEKENKRSSLVKSNLKQKRPRQSSSTDKSDTDENNLRKKAKIQQKTEKSNSHQHAKENKPNVKNMIKAKPETLKSENHSRVVHSSHSSKRLKGPVSQGNRYISNKQTNTHIPDSEDERKSKRNEHSYLNKITNLKKNIKIKESHNKKTANAQKDSTTDSDSDFEIKTDKKNIEKAKQVSLRKISISSSDSSESDDNSYKKKLESSESVFKDSDSDSLKENKNRRNSLRKTTLKQTDVQDISSDSSGTEDTSTESETKEVAKNNEKHNQKVQDSDSNSDVKEKENKRNNSRVIKRKRQDSDKANTDDNRRNILRKKSKIQKTDVDNNTDRQTQRYPLQHSTKTQTKSNRQDDSDKLSKPASKSLQTDNVNKDNNKSDSSKYRKESNLNSVKKDSDSDEVFDKLSNKRDVLRKRNRIENKVDVFNHKKTLQRDENTKDKVSKDVEASSDNDKRQNKTILRHTSNKTTFAKGAEAHVISKRGGSKEYSNLEDHAIVAWLSVGGRARRVNGNQLWKELLEQYRNLTGLDRSWHSLRNRYLRYILPSLGALGLPPGDVSRLRAAAATGELKAKRMSNNRRNSIFKEKVVRPAFRPRRPPPTPAPTAGPASRAGSASRHSTEKQTQDGKRRDTKTKQRAVEVSRRSSRASVPRRLGADHSATSSNTSRRNERSIRRSLRSLATVNTPQSSSAPGINAATSTPTTPPTPTRSKMRKLFNPKIVHDDVSED